MVNKTHIIKKTILEILRTNQNPISGVAISDKLGFSRVALWKHIQSLIESGYIITSSAKGYSIDTSEDYLYPWEFPNIEHTIVHLDHTTSTMIEASRKNYKTNTIIVTEYQTEGRGTNNRNWDSQKGGLFFTMIHKDKTPALLYMNNCLYILGIIHKILKELYSIESQVKSPNDILYKGKKICGILTEALISGDVCTYVFSGVGINVNNNPEPKNSISISEILNKPISRRTLLYEFIKQFELLKDNKESIINQTKQLMKFK